MNKEAIERHMKYLQEDKYDREFYVALLLYDVKGLTVDDLNNDIINKAFEISNSYDSIYNEDMRDRLLYDFDYEKVEEEEEEEEEEEVLEKGI